MPARGPLPRRSRACPKNQKRWRPRSMNCGRWPCCGVVRRTSASCEQRSRRSARSRVAWPGWGSPVWMPLRSPMLLPTWTPNSCRGWSGSTRSTTSHIPSGHQGEQFTLPRESSLILREVPCPGSRAAGPRVRRNPAGHFLVGTGRRCALCPELTTARRPRVAPARGVAAQPGRPGRADVCADRRSHGMAGAGGGCGSS